MIRRRMAIDLNTKCANLDSIKEVIEEAEEEA